MLLYMAPMEGVTGYIYRQAYHRCFYPMDRYFTPFIAPKQAGSAGQAEDGMGRVMLGRGLIRNPGLAGELAGQRPAGLSQLRRFHELLWQGYLEVMGEEKNALFKMKELWSYMQELFRADSRLMKKLKKSRNGKEYLETVEEIFERAAQDGSFS